MVDRNSEIWPAVIQKWRLESFKNGAVAVSAVARLKNGANRTGFKNGGKRLVADRDQVLAELLRDGGALLGHDRLLI